MATAAVARPGQLPRHRRDAPRPTVTKRPNPIADGSEESSSKKRKLDEPFIRDSAYILKKHKGKPSSLILHLHQTHFKFEGQDGSFAYDSPMRFIITHLQRQTVPHEMLEEMLSSGNVPFYDGCLIVEVHDHTNTAKEKKANGSSKPGAGKDTTKFSMHAYNEHIVPSPLAPYPKEAKGEDSTEKRGETTNGEMGAPARPSSKGSDKEKNGPKIRTLVLHPTPLSRHHELLILSRTPATDMRSKRKGDAATPQGANPATPVTPVGTGRGQNAASQKMCLEEKDFYSFQGDLLVSTEPLLYLEPANNPQEAEAILQMLSADLHGNKPPSPKTRKRTTAEMAADDAQAAETERRMLIMDERIKPSARSGAGGAGNENQGVAAAFGFSRFKTIEMVRQKHEEQERTKEEEERAALQKRQAEEAAQQKIMAANKQARELQQRQQGGLLMQQQRQEQMRQQQLEAQRQALANRELAQQQHALMQNQQAGNFQHPQGSMSQSSPVVRQQTPMMNSSPMMGNGGFPMTQNPSQGAGSPPRPSSAAMLNRNVAMARQVSQQHGSQGNTPQMGQGTPGMTAAIPNRQLSQTPRMQPGSPAMAMQGTPTPTGMGMSNSQLGMQQGQLRPEQMAMLQQQQALAQQNNSLRANSPAQGNMTPEQIQTIRMNHQARQAALLQAQATANGQQGQQGNTQATAAAYRQHMMRQAAHQQYLRQAQAQLQANGQAGSPPQQGNNMQQGTPQMNLAHQQLQQNGMNPGMQNQDGTLTQQQQHVLAQQKAVQLQAQRQAQIQLQNLSQQYNGWNNIPQSVIGSLPQQAQQLIKTQIIRQNQLRQAQAQRAQQMSQGNGGTPDQQQVPGQPNPQYMQTLRANQAMLLQHQQQMNQGGVSNQQAMNAMAMNMNMGNMGQGNQFGGNQQNNGDLTHAFANMQNALNHQQRNQQGGMGGGQ